MSYKFKNLIIDDIEHEDFKPQVPTVYKIFWDGLEFDFLINYRENCRKAVIFGTGAVGKNISEYPVFSRSTWLDEIPYIGIWYFDASLYMYKDVNLAWGYGAQERWVLENTAFLLNKILSKQSVLYDDTLFFGSSGGGYTSIILSTMFHSRACVFNPQLNIENYYKKGVNNLKQAVFGNDFETRDLIKSRASVVKHFLREGYVPDIELYVNSQSFNDTYMQEIPFLKELMDNRIQFGENVKLNYFYAENGHSGMIDRRKTISIIEKSMETPMVGERYINTKQYKIDKFFDRISGNYSPYIDTSLEE